MYFIQRDHWLQHVTGILNRILTIPKKLTTISRYCNSECCITFQIENKGILWSKVQNKIWSRFNPSNSKSHISCPESLPVDILDNKNQINNGTV